MDTYTLKKADIKKQWHLIDAKGQTVGRIASRIAHILRGKHKTCFSPHLDCGDNVVVVNAADATFTSNKITKKKYVYYTGYVGGQREIPYTELLRSKPEFIIQHAVKGMLGKNKLGAKQMKHLRVFAHDHNLQSLKFVNES
jgi:large subunit ribosomal protein L13